MTRFVVKWNYYSSHFVMSAKLVSKETVGSKFPLQIEHNKADFSSVSLSLFALTKT